MSEPLAPDRPQRLLTDLCRLVNERAAVEKRVGVEVAARNKTAEAEYQQGQRTLDKRYQAKKKAADEEFVSRRNAAIAKLDANRAALEKEHKALRTSTIAKFAAEQKEAQQAKKNAHADAMEAAETSRGGVNLPLEEVLAGLDVRWREMEKIFQQAVEILSYRGYWDEFREPPDVPLILEKHPGRRFCHALEQAQQQFQALSKQFLPKLLHGFRPFGLLFLLWAAVAYPAFLLFPKGLWWLVTSTGFTALVGVVALWIASLIAERRSVKGFLALQHTLLEAGLGNPAVLETAKSECRHLDETILARHKAQLKEADQEYIAATARIEAERQRELTRIEEEFPKRMEELETQRAQTLQSIDDEHQPRLRKIDEQYAADSAELQARRDQAVEETRLRFEREWNAMAELWTSGVERFRASCAQLDSACHELFPDWNSDDWARWAPPSATPPIIRFAASRVRLAEMRDGMPDDERLRPPQIEFPLPILVPYPSKSLLLFKASGADLTRAVDAMQSAMLRMLTAMPPSKVRFTIIDPVGLGDNFSAFMHLADYDEQLVASRIWTDANHIEQRLADLTKHMENVIQVYLRKEFHSIDEYNASAGEMAEPYRVLVVANFPANFSETAVQRIKSIVASGARCGVFVMLSVDTALPLPRNIQLADLEADAVPLHWADGAMVLEHPDFGTLRADVDRPPDAERFKEILHGVGSKAKDAGRVEVPFSCIIPDVSEWWTCDSRDGLEVPLGRAGAMKLQSLSLGSGTSQHVLISGKTGSGKSTLLHVLVTNLALRYSPDEVHLYLVDFKKGVEFKAYARAALPHARVIAIESEREFGLSVLQRLDAELRERGDLFRKYGVQDVRSYRNAHPDAKLPRIMLIIDEFQELFVEDDRIAQEASLLLDRLVRQGRAFGIHVLLGSQTLGGAYSLARSTVGQMAVRIALQCSEADSHLILSEDNTAARLLTRPGEAIYNDANGLYEGNHPFQIVWLSDTDRDDYLRSVRRLTEQKGCAPPPAIVFEGNIFADPADNPALKTLLASRSWPASSPAVPAWLGAAVAIKAPTATTFARQHASNLLIVGHREDAAMGIQASCLISLAAQHLPKPSDDGVSGTRFYVLDGMRTDAPLVGFWNRLAEVVPHELKLANVRGMPELIAEVAAELASRQEQGRENAAPIYLFVHNLGRFRDMKKEEEYGFSSDEKAASPARQFASILREGPPLGIHTVAWCDTYSNVSRMLDRQGLRDFEMRVLFQMNASDSSSLMDSPDATRLGVHRAFLYDEGQGRVEKFSPYGVPSAEWLASVQKQLAR